MNNTPNSRTCLIEECNNPPHARGLCGGHVYRLKNGLKVDTLLNPKEFTAESVFEYFTEEVDHGLVWTGSVRKSDGYGIASFSGKQTYAHRLAWELKYGSIPAGMEVDHAPECPHNCVTVEHLTLRTKSEHAVEGWKRGQFNGNGWTAESRAKRMRTKSCSFCGTVFTKSSKALYCSSTCNQRAYRRRNR